MRRRLLLLRHGEVDYFPQGRPVPPEGVGLTERGRAQARAVGALLREVPLDLAVHTGLRRTEETLALVLEGRAVPVEVWPEFQEIRPGRLKDLSDPERAFREAFRPRDLEERFLGESAIATFWERSFLLTSASSPASGTPFSSWPTEGSFGPSSPMPSPENPAFFPWRFIPAASPF